MIQVERCSDFDDCWLLCSRLVHHHRNNASVPEIPFDIVTFLLFQFSFFLIFFFSYSTTPNSSLCMPVKTWDWCISGPQSACAILCCSVGACSGPSGTEPAATQPSLQARHVLHCLQVPPLCRITNVNRSLRTLLCLNPIPWLVVCVTEDYRISVNPCIKFLHSWAHSMIDQQCSDLHHLGSDKKAHCQLCCDYGLWLNYGLDKGFFLLRTHNDDYHCTCLCRGVMQHSGCDCSKVQKALFQVISQSWSLHLHFAFVRWWILPVSTLEDTLYFLPRVFSAQC